MSLNRVTVESKSSKAFDGKIKKNLKLALPPIDLLDSIYLEHNLSIREFVFDGQTFSYTMGKVKGE
ncbi:CLUMA_CG001925, isoform A [Clunio marinus]|uniref:CLUMA_CG001925, isoform A n=1 Tax=Clunio marinus TaxID=568069 RepID=A0A1J1HL59_9DIPT|nr:CLUMA_CG001925, isoform A [Clunio marinus]